MSQTALNIEFLRSALSERLVGCRVLHYDSLDSTMDETRKLAEQGAPEGTVVIAEEQTAGRGRFNRAWIAPRGQNLSFSVLLHPTQTQLPFINMAATLAVSKTIAGFAGLAPTIKWPNDVRVNGRKIAGILIETAMELSERVQAVVGMGLNVNFDPSRFPEIASTSTSIFKETGQLSDRTEVLVRLLEHFDEYYCAVNNGDSLTKDWASQLETLGRNVQVRWQDQVFEGRAEAVDDQGNLILVRSDGSKVTVVAGEVTLQI